MTDSYVPAEICNKIQNTMLCIKELLQLETRLIEENKLSEASSLAAEKDFLTGVIRQYSESIDLIMQKKLSAVHGNDLKSHYSKVRDLAHELLVIVTENTRVLAKRLHINDTVTKSTQSFMQKQMRTLNLYNASGRNLDLVRRSGMKSFIFNAMV